MFNLSTVTLEGFVTQDPVLRKTKTEKSVLNFTLAVNHRTKSKDGKAVSYIDVETWEKLAELCSRNVTKGRRLLVVGPIRQDRWENEDGKIQSKVKIVASDIRYIENMSTGNELEKKAS